MKNSYDITEELALKLIEESRILSSREVVVSSNGEDTYYAAVVSLKESEKKLGYTHRMFVNTGEETRRLLTYTTDGDRWIRLA